VTDNPEVGLFGARLTYDAQPAEVAITSEALAANATCPTWRQTVKVNDFRIADDSEADPMVGWCR
jgi:hypothetical protein